MALSELAGRSAVLYAWCPCGAEETCCEAEGGSLREDTLERFMRRHAGHPEAAYCDLEGRLHFGGPDGPTHRRP